MKVSVNLLLATLLSSVVLVVGCVPGVTSTTPPKLTRRPSPVAASPTAQSRSASSTPEPTSTRLLNPNEIWLEYEYGWEGYFQLGLGKLTDLSMGAEEDRVWISTLGGVYGASLPGFKMLEANHSIEWPVDIEYVQDLEIILYRGRGSIVGGYDTQADHILYELDISPSIPSTMGAVPQAGELLVGTFEGTLYAFDITNGSARWSLEAGTSITAIEVSPDGRFIALGLLNGGIQIWDAASQEMRRTIDGHSERVNSLSFSPDSEKIASGGDDNLVYEWHAMSGELLHEYEGHNGFITAVEYSNNGQRIASGSDDTTVKIWNVGEVSEAMTLTAHSSSVLSVVHGLDDDALVSASADGRVITWELSTGDPITIGEGFLDPLSGIALNHSERTLGGCSNEILFWRLETLSQPRSWSGISSPPIVIETRTDQSCVGILLDPDRPAIHVALEDGSIGSTILEQESKLRIVSPPTSLNTQRSASFALAGRGALVALTNQESVEVRDVITGTMVLNKFVDQRPAIVSLTQQGDWLLVGYDSGAVEVWDPIDGTTLFSFPRASSPVTAVSGNPTQSLIAVGFADGSVVVWNDGDTIEEVLTETIDGSEVTALTFSSDGERLIAGTMAASLTHFDTKTWERFDSSVSQDGPINSLDFDPVENAIVSASGDGTILFWYIDQSAGK